MVINFFLFLKNSLIVIKLLFYLYIYVTFIFMCLFYIYVSIISSSLNIIG